MGLFSFGKKEVPEVSIPAEAKSVEELNQESAENVELNNTQEDPLAVGRERLALVGEKISQVKEIVAKKGNALASKLGRFWNNTKKVTGNIVAGAAMSDVFAKQGYDYSVEKVKEFDEWTDKGANITGKNIGRAGAELVSSTGDMLVKGYDAMDRGYDSVEKFVVNKGEQISQFAKDTANLSKDAAFYAKEKTVEGLQTAKEGVKNKYESVKSFSENAILSAQERVAKIKENHRKSMNMLRMRRLEAEIQKIADKESSAMQKAENLRKQKEALISKMELTDALSIAA